jgi:fatty acid desaturase
MDRAKVDPIRSDYTRLRRLIRERRLLEKSSLRYAAPFFMVAAILAASLTALPFLDKFWLRMLDAAVVAFAFGQIGFLAHDAAHGQIVGSRTGRSLLSLFLWNAMLGISYSWWADKHNKHHAYPNDPDHDPDLDISVLAFSREQYLGKPVGLRPLLRLQAYLLLPLLLLLGFSLRLSTIMYLSYRIRRGLLLEATVVSIHFVLFVVYATSILGIAQGAAFVAVHHSLSGLYLGSVFAPNHKGMPLLRLNECPSFLLRQITTARNVRGGFITDYLYGGLNYQIEHHLFPHMPRHNLRKCSQLVRAFCLEHHIAYHETGAVGAMKEILTHLNQVVRSSEQAGS